MSQGFKKILGGGYNNLHQVILPREHVAYTSTKGLLNGPGQNNCFLNSAVQVLWHLDIFRRSFRELSGHACMAESCIFCALKELFGQLQFSQESALPPDALRRALAESFFDQQRFQLGFMDDAAECFENILLRIHYHIASNQQEDMCNARHCIPHQKFAMTLVEQSVCQACHVTSEPLSYTQMVHYVSASALTTQASKLSKADKTEHMFGELLRKAGGMGDIRDCPSSCGAKIQINRALMNHPEIVSVGVVWDSERPTLDHIMAVFATIGTTLRLADVFHTVVDQHWATATQHTLVGVVTYYGKHYSTFFFHTKLRVWIYFDDANVREIGPRFEQVVEKCRRGRYQPLLLLYAVQGGSPCPTDSAPKSIVQVPMKPFRPNHPRSVTPSPEKTPISVTARRAITPTPRDYQNLTDYQAAIFSTNKRPTLPPDGLAIPEHLNVPRRRDSGNWSGDRNSASSTSSMENPYLYLVNKLSRNGPPLPRSPTSKTPGIGGDVFVDPGYDSYSLSSNDSVKQSTEGLCLEADQLLEKSHQLEASADLETALVLCRAAAGKTRAALEAPYNNPSTLTHARMKHNACVMRGRSLHRRLIQLQQDTAAEIMGQEDSKLDIRHSRENSSSSVKNNNPLKNVMKNNNREIMKSNLNNQQSMKNSVTFHEPIKCNDSKSSLPTKSSPNNPKSKNVKSIEIYATLPKKKKDSKEFVEEDSEYMYDRPGRSRSLLSPKKKEDTKRARSEERNKIPSNITAKPEKEKGKKQHKIRRKLLMGGLIRLKNRSMPDLRDPDEAQPAAPPKEIPEGGYLSEGGGNPVMERSRLMRKSSHGSVGKVLLPPRVPPLPPLRTTSQLTLKTYEPVTYANFNIELYNGDQLLPPYPSPAASANHSRQASEEFPPPPPPLDEAAQDLACSSQQSSQAPVTGYGSISPMQLSGYSNEQAPLGYSETMPTQQMYSQTPYPSYHPAPSQGASTYGQELGSSSVYQKVPSQTLSSQPISSSAYNPMVLQQASYSCVSQIPTKSGPVQTDSTYLQGSGQMTRARYSQGSNQSSAAGYFQGPTQVHSQSPSGQTLSNGYSQNLAQTSSSGFSQGSSVQNPAMDYSQSTTSQSGFLQQTPQVAATASTPAPTTQVSSQQWLKELQAKQAARKVGVKPPTTTANQEVEENLVSVKNLTSRFENIHMVPKQETSNENSSFSPMINRKASFSSSTNESASFTVPTNRNGSLASPANENVTASPNTFKKTVFTTAANDNSYYYATNDRTEGQSIPNINSYYPDNQSLNKVNTNHSTNDRTSFPSVNDDSQYYQPANESIETFPPTDESNKNNSPSDRTHLTSVDVPDGNVRRRKSCKKKSVTFCDEVILVATAEEQQDDSFIPNPILQRVLQSQQQNRYPSPPSTYQVSPSQHSPNSQHSPTNQQTPSTQQNATLMTLPSQQLASTQTSPTYPQQSLTSQPSSYPQQSSISQPSSYPLQSSTTQPSSYPQQLPTSSTNSPYSQQSSSQPTNPGYPLQQSQTTHQNVMYSTQQSSKPNPTQTPQQSPSTQHQPTYQHLPTSSPAYQQGAPSQQPTYQHLPISAHSYQSITQPTSAYQHVPTGLQKPVAYQQVPVPQQSYSNQKPSQQPSYQHLPLNSSAYQPQSSNQQPIYQIQPAQTQQAAYQHLPTNSPSYQSQLSNQQTNYQTHPSPQPTYQTQAPQQPTYQTQPTQQPTYQSQLNQQPTYQSQPNQQPAYQAQPTQQPTYQTQPNQQPSYQSQPSQQPTYQTQPTQQPTYQSQPNQQATYQCQPNQQPTYQHIPNTTSTTHHNSQAAQSRAFPPYQHPPAPRQGLSPPAAPCNLCRKKPVVSPAVYCSDCHFYMSRFKPRAS